MIDITRIDRRIIFLLIAVAVVVFLYCPFHLPVRVDPSVRYYFEAIEALEPGDVVVMSAEYAPSTEPEIRYMHENSLYHLFYKDVKVICINLWPQSPELTEKYLGSAKELVERHWGKEKTHGADYVELPYIAGEEVAMVNVATSIPDALPLTCEKEGKRLKTASLPVMEGVTGFGPDPVTGERKVKLLVDMTSGEPGVREWIRNVGKRFGTPIVAGVTSVMATDLYPFMQSGQLEGFLGGLPAAQQYEVLLRRNNIRKSASPIDENMSIQSALHFLIIALIAIGNAGYFLKKRRESE